MRRLPACGATGLVKLNPTTAITGVVCLCIVLSTNMLPTFWLGSCREDMLQSPAMVVMAAAATVEADSHDMSERLYSWLKRIRIQHHADALSLYGVNDMATAVLLDTTDLEDLGFSVIEIRKFLKAQSRLSVNANDDNDLIPSTGDGTAETLAELRSTMEQLPDSYSDMNLAALLEEATMAAEDGENNDASLADELGASLELLNQLELSGMTIDDLMQLGEEHASGGIRDSQLLKKIVGMPDLRETLASIQDEL